MSTSFVLDGHEVEVPVDDGTLLDALRDHLGVRSVKDGCSPQGQCGCCTVLVDGAPRVSCVTPVRRVAGRAITTVAGLGDTERGAWADALCATGGSQCGFCTPGIVLRLEAVRRRADADRAAGAPADAPADAPTDAPADALDPAVANGLAAHLCRCTGWRTIVEAYDRVLAGGAPAPDPARDGGRSLADASRRATIEGRSPQRVDRSVALGDGGFADDLAPAGALVAVPDGRGGWAVGETLAEARTRAGKVQGRRTTIDVVPPLEAPPGAWVATLATSWVEPAYLETDASWCEPGGEPCTPLGNGGAFGGKVASPLPAIARELADEHGRAVRVLWSREDAVRGGPKRPPVAGGIRADGTGVLRVARTPGIAAAIARVAPDLEVEEVDLPGPPTSAAIRGAGWVEALVLRSATRPLGPDGAVEVTSPDGAVARARVADGRVLVEVRAGEPLDRVVLRSYAIGAAHQAWGWVGSEGIAVDDQGVVHDLTIRSFGIVRAADMPVVEVAVLDDDGPPVNASDAVLAAVAAARWLDLGRPPAWPAARGTRSR